jgi:hypothetical protein
MPQGGMIANQLKCGLIKCCCYSRKRKEKKKKEKEE